MRPHTHLVIAQFSGDRSSMTHDISLETAGAIVTRTLDGSVSPPVVRSFFHESSNTVSYVVHDVKSRQAAIIDPVMDYEAATSRLSSGSAQEIYNYVKSAELLIEWLLETHIHADHISAAPWLKDRLGGSIAIGAEVKAVQDIFGPLFNTWPMREASTKQFDMLLGDGERLEIGGLEAIALHLPGHTPADVGFIIGDAAFVGDTIFMPDYGTARTDFPGGDARKLYRSIRRLLRLPRETRVFVCHDYKVPGRDSFEWETTIGAQRDANIHVRDTVDEESFVSLRTGRDRMLSPPQLLLQSIQMNMRAGNIPDPEDNGISYLKIPINCF